ncbi:MAG: 1-(5-phosphoribosyl)-5-[(5-phosphoribosylamino)methylideneamino]imidazole-4-carboxamide isomerase [Clostridiales bacterium]|nr:1-(5-phosphoribosyl)-5-[(5-phosphoribosylamino)methylideneamino]imidazole-4-carboxamide isomerase [Clostridiales bacterium]
MILFPAIDLYRGDVVRLYQGDYDRMTVYAHDPAEVARTMQSLGATHLHVVDLEGAQAGAPKNLAPLKKIHEATGLFIEAGGGVRTQEDVAAFLNAGASRVILGTMAARDPAFLRRVALAYPGKLAVSADLNNGQVMVRGWTESSAMTVTDMVHRLTELGIDTMIVTDISRDGALQGVNEPLYARLADSGLQVIASGGVTTIDDVRALRAMGLYGAIVGRAWYEGSFDLAKGLQEASA